jgi:hypothetical protein
LFNDSLPGSTYNIYIPQNGKRFHVDGFAAFPVTAIKYNERRTTSGRQQPLSLPLHRKEDQYEDSTVERHDPQP